MEPIVEDDSSQELKVTFLPELHLQRRIWVLSILRKESVTRVGESHIRIIPDKISIIEHQQYQVLDVGCGEGQLLVPLSQPAPWLPPPPASILPPNNEAASSAYNDDGIPNLHISHLYGLDTCKYDLEFAARETAPPNFSSSDTRSYYHVQPRWEELEVKLWEGGLEVVNEEFVGIECIASTEV